MSVKQKIARKAVAKTAKHSATGTASKLRREPVRAATLLAVGGVIGLIVGLLASRAGGTAGAQDVES